MCVCMLCVQRFETFVDCSPPAPLSVGFSRRDSWSRLHKALLLLLNHPIPYLLIQPMCTAASSELEYSFSI